MSLLVAALAFPSLARRRPAGEFLIMAAGILGVVLAFALGEQGS